MSQGRITRAYLKLWRADDVLEASLKFITFNVCIEIILVAIMIVHVLTS